MIEDWLRLGVFIAAGGSVGLALVVVWSYARVYRRHRKSSEAKWRGLLPLHVTLIGISYLIFVFGSVVEVSNQVGDGLTWRSPTYLIANALGAIALWVILGTSRYRQHDLTPPG